MDEKTTLGLMQLPHLADHLEAAGFQVVGGGDFRTAGAEISQNLKAGETHPVIVGAGGVTPPGAISFVRRLALGAPVAIVNLAESPGAFDELGASTFVAPVLLSSVLESLGLDAGGADGNILPDGTFATSTMDAFDISDTPLPNEVATPEVPAVVEYTQEENALAKPEPFTDLKVPAWAVPESQATQQQASSISGPTPKVPSWAIPKQELVSPESPVREVSTPAEPPRPSFGEATKIPSWAVQPETPTPALVEPPAPTTSAQEDTPEPSPKLPSWMQPTHNPQEVENGEQSAPARESASEDAPFSESLAHQSPGAQLATWEPPQEVETIADPYEVERAMWLASLEEGHTVLVNTEVGVVEASFVAFEPGVVHLYYFDAEHSSWFPWTVEAMHVFSAPEPEPEPEPLPAQAPQVAEVDQVQAPTQPRERDKVKDWNWKPVHVDEIARPDTVDHASALVPTSHTPKPGTKIIFVFSGKGGVGKTTTARTLAQRAATGWGKHVTLVDANSGQGDQRTFLRLSDTDLPDAYSVALGSPAEDVLISPAQVNSHRGSLLAPVGFALALAPQPHLANHELVTGEIYTQIVDAAAQISDLVVVDLQMIDAGHVESKTSFAATLVLPQLQTGAFGLGLTEGSKESMRNLRYVLEQLRDRAPGADLLSAVTLHDPSNGFDVDEAKRRLEETTSFVGVTTSSPHLKGSLAAGVIDPTDPSIVGVLDETLTRMFGPPPPQALAAKSPKRRRRLFGRGR